MVGNGRDEPRWRLRFRRRAAAGAAAALLAVGLLPIYLSQTVGLVVSLVLLAVIPLGWWITGAAIRLGDEVNISNRRRDVKSREWTAGRMTYLAIEDAKSARTRLQAESRWSVEALKAELETTLLPSYVGREQREDDDVQRLLDDLARNVWHLLGEDDASVPDFSGPSPGDLAVEAARKLVRIGWTPRDDIRYPILDPLRIAGPGVVGIFFLVVWTLIYTTVWSADATAFAGLGASPRLGELIYLAVSGTLGGTPEGIEARSAVGQMAVSAELLTALFGVGFFVRTLERFDART